ATGTDTIEEEIQWLNDTYEKNKTPFVITETLPKDEMYNTVRLNNLYEQSPVFREMSAMKNGVFTVQKPDSFWKSGDDLTEATIHRTAVMVENANDLYIDFNYSMTEGNMSLFVVSPSGKEP
ncbi:MAG: hypothetical protein LBU77_00995, partial [Clostridiales bacterium]|nr:hypothetical protein [Clostridiales bacterium]